MSERHRPRPTITPTPPSVFSRATRRAMRRAHRTCVTGKVGYRTYRKALRSLEALRSDGRGNECAIYHCPHCPHWHLTSRAPASREHKQGVGA